MESKTNEPGILGTLFSYAYKLNDNANLLKMGASHCLELANVAANVFVPIIVSNFVEEAAKLNTEDIFGEDNEWSAYAPLIIGSSAYLLTAVLPKIRNCMVGSVRHDSQKNIVLDMARGLYESNLDEVIENPAGDYIKKLTSNYLSVDRIMPNLMSDVLPVVLETAGISSVLCYRYGPIGVTPAVTLLAYLVLAFVGEKSSKSFKDKNGQALGEAYSALLEATSNYQIAHQYGNVEHELEKLEEALANLEKTYNRLNRVQERNGLLLSVVSRLSLLVPFAYEAIAPGSLFEADDFILLAYYLLRFGSITEALPPKLSELYKGWLDAKETIKFLNKPKNSEERYLNMNFHLDSPPCIEFNNINFSYGEGKPGLTNISFTVEPGQKVALMGKTGSGKSTLLKLIQRFHDDYEGEIGINGVDIKKLRKANLREFIGVVSQDIDLTRGTVADNVRYSDLDAPIQEVLSATRFAGLDFSESELLSEIQEQGLNFSGGERQRISIARTLLKRSAHIFLLDEPTSSLDQKTAKEVSDRLDQLTLNSTTIMVTHDPNLAINADLILYMEEGEIVESGNFVELMEKEGKFYEQLMVKCDQLGISPEDIQPAEKNEDDQEYQAFLAWREKRRRMSKSLYDSNVYPLDMHQLEEMGVFPFEIDDDFSSYIREIILSRRSLPMGEVVLKTIAALMGSIGGIPYAQASYDAAQNIPIPYLGYFFAGCTILAYGSGAIWCLVSNVDRLYPSSYEEQRLTNNKASYSLGTHIICNLLSLIVSIIPAYTAYEFNTVKWLSIISFAISYNFNIFGFYTLVELMNPANLKNLIKKLGQLCGCARDEEALLIEAVEDAPNLMATFAGFLQYSKIAVNQMSSSQINDLFNSLFERNMSPRELMRLVRHLGQQVSLTDVSDRLFWIQLLSLVIPVSDAIVNGFLSYGASKLVIDNDYFAVPFVFLTITPYLFMKVYVVLGGVTQIASTIFNACEGNLNDDIIAKNLCGCSAMINGLSFVLALLSSAQSAYISFTTVSSPLNWVITSITTTSNVIFETYILAIIMRTSLEYLVSKLSNSSFYEKIIAIQEQLSKIQKILEFVQPELLERYSQDILPRQDAIINAGELEESHSEEFNYIINEGFFGRGGASLLEEESAGCCCLN